MKFGQWTTIAMIAGVFAGGALGIAGCRRKPAPPPAITRPPLVAPPTTADAIASALENRLKDFDIIPPMGEAKSIQTPDGESWMRYDNGIMIQEIRIGLEGMPPRLGQTVSIAYVGTFPGSNKEFDRSPPDKPLEFELGARNQVIRGLSMGVSTMLLKGKRRIFIPAEFGYGIQGSMPKIPPDQPLIFQVELLTITGKAIELPPVPKVEPAGPPAPATTTAMPAATATTPAPAQ